jgi:hypothetical protein
VGHHGDHHFSNALSKLGLFVSGGEGVVFFMVSGWLVAVDAREKGLEHLITILKLENKKVIMREGESKGGRRKGKSIWYNYWETIDGVGIRERFVFLYLYLVHILIICATIRKA